MHVHDIFSLVADAGEEAIRRSHVLAVSDGAANLRAEAETLRPWSSLTLMCGAVAPALDLALRTQSFQIQADIVGDPGHELLRPALRGLGEAAAVSVRLASRALEEHAREVGYATHPWFERAVEDTRAVLRPGVPAPSDVASEAALALAGAVEASDGDLMAVPLRLSAAIGRAGAVYMLAGALLD